MKHLQKIATATSPNSCPNNRFSSPVICYLRQLSFEAMYSTFIGTGIEPAVGNGQTIRFALCRSCPDADALRVKRCNLAIAAGKYGIAGLNKGIRIGSIHPPDDRAVAAVDFEDYCVSIVICIIRINDKVVSTGDRSYTGSLVCVDFAEV